MGRRMMPRIEVACPGCGAPRAITASQARHGKGSYCSKKCIGRAAANTPESFWSHVAIGALDQCWPWTFTVGRWGYGVYQFEGRVQRAHRIAYALAKGAVPEGLVVCHACDVKLCVNPNHLWPGTQADNVRDYQEKRGHRAA